MNHCYERILCLLLSMVLCIGMMTPAVYAENDAQSSADERTETGSSGAVPGETGSVESETTESETTEPETTESETTEPETTESETTEPETTESETTEPETTESETTEPETSEPAKKEFTMSFVIGEDARMFHDGRAVVAESGTEIDISDARYTPRRTGYAFYGWYSEETCTAGNEVRGVQTLNGDITLYAKWVKMTAPDHNTVIGQISQGHYTGDAYSDPAQEDFVKISHPYYPASSNKYNPAGKDKNDPEITLHSYEVYNDGLLDYLGRLDGGVNAPGDGQKNQTAASGVPLEDRLENALGGKILAEGQGDRGMSYSWSGQGYGDWMYVTLQFNPTGQTGQMMGTVPTDESIFKTYGGDFFNREPDYGDPGCALCKINVKTGEVKVLMSTAKNRLNTQFRNSIPFQGKLYFCGSVNHMPSIYEIDPETDAFQCVYQDESMVTFPGGMGAAWAEAQKDHLCPAIRGMTAFRFGDQEFLVISCVGMDANPYIAVSDNPSSGHFTKIAYNYEPDSENTVPGELRGYAACRLTDSIFGGSIWEMAQIENRLYVALCTGTPANAVKDGDEVVSMQSFALIEGVLREGGKVDNRADWTWNVIAGDQERDGAPYTFGFDPERTCAGACNLQVFNGDLYIGEYNDNQIAFKNLKNHQFKFIINNMDQSISLYRLNHETHRIELVMGTPTKLFRSPVATITDSETNLQRDVSGFGRRENQYVWQSKVFDGRMYLGTMDITALLKPLGKRISGEHGNSGRQMAAELDAIAEQAAQSAAALSGEPSVEQELLEMREFYEDRKNASTMADFVEQHVTDPFVPLPASVFDAPVMIEVDSPATLYAAMMAISDLMRGSDQWDEQEALLSQVRLAMQAEEVLRYTEQTEDEIPEALRNVVETFRREEYTKIHDFKTMMIYMKDSIAGFDLLVTENGVDFKAVTRTGMGDPYNSGLRVFATNVKEDEQQTNPWMTIGSANQFYGTQIWRMEGDHLQLQNVSSEKMYVQIRFIDEEGNEIGHATESDIGRAQILHVDADRKTIDGKVLTNLYPDGALPREDTPASFEIREDNGTHYIEVPVRKAYTLRFAVNGGRRIPDLKVPAGQTVDLTDEAYCPVKEDSVFAGWFMDRKCTEDSRVTEIVMDGHKVVYAKWEANQVTLHFETNGGSALEDVTARENTQINLKDYVTTREGYDFAGWFLDAAFTKPAEILTLTENMTVYAKWEKQTFTLHFETNGGSALEDVIAEPDTEISLADCVTNRPEHFFMGWFLDEELTQEVKTVKLTRDLTVYAKWEKVNPFTDVQKTDYFYDAVLWAVQSGVTYGTSDTTFSPELSCTRSQAVTFLWSMAGRPEPRTTENPFTDVQPEDYFYKAVLWAVENNITAGMGHGTFGPEAVCKRAQIVSFLWRYAGAPVSRAENGFTDVDSEDYFYNAVLWAVENGITTGMTPSSFGPEADCIRAHIVMFLWRAAGSPEPRK